MKKSGRRKKINQLFENLSTQTIRILSVWCLIVVFLLNIFYTAQVSYRLQEKVTIHGSSWKWIPAALILLIVLYLWNRFFGEAEEKKVFGICTLLYLCAGLYFLFNIDPSIRSDAYDVYQAALRMAQDDYIYFSAPDKYLRIYPNQLGLVTYNRIAGLFSCNMQFLVFLNLLEVIGINYFTCRTCNLFFKNRKVNNLTILLSFLFVPQFFFILFKYGLIPGFFFMTGGFYFAVKFISCDKKRYFLYTVIFSAAAAVLKMNYMIGGIAVAVILIIHALKKAKWKYAAAAVVLLACIFLSGRCVRYAYEMETGTDLSGGMPASLWVVMGTDIDNDEVRGPGWYNSQSFIVLGDHNNYDYAAADREGKKMLAGNFSKMRENPMKTVSFFRNKIISMWCEPLYQSVWSGPIDDGITAVHKPVLMSLYQNGIVGRGTGIFMKGELMILLLAAILFLLFETPGYPLAVYPQLYFLGGFLFHIFWEAKSQYVYTYIFVLIPLCTFELCKGCGWIQKKCKNRDFFPRKDKKEPGQRLKDKSSCSIPVIRDENTLGAGEKQEWETEFLSQRCAASAFPKNSKSPCNP